MTTHSPRENTNIDSPEDELVRKVISAGYLSAMSSCPSRRVAQGRSPSHTRLVLVDIIAKRTCNHDVCRDFERQASGRDLLKMGRF